MESFPAMAVFDQPRRWNSRWTSAQSCTSYTLPPQVRSDLEIFDHWRTTAQFSIGVTCSVLERRRQLLHHAHVMVTEGESVRRIDLTSGKRVVPLAS
jgi:hypothetical protein